MTSHPLVIWGTSGHAQFVAEIVCCKGGYTVVGYADNVRKYSDNAMINNVPVYSGPDIFHALRRDGIRHIAPGFGNCTERIKLVETLEKNDFEAVTLIHPRATVSKNATIGKGTIIGPGAIIDPNCIIGNGVIINNAATICHDTQIGDGTHICPGVTICGKVSIASRCWIGAGACIIDTIKIGSKSFIGAGSVVTKNIPDGVTAYGNPAKVVRAAETF